MSLGAGGAHIKLLPELEWQLGREFLRASAPSSPSSASASTMPHLMLMKETFQRPVSPSLRLVLHSTSSAHFAARGGNVALQSARELSTQPPDGSVVLWNSSLAARELCRGTCPLWAAADGGEAVSLHWIRSCCKRFLIPPAALNRAHLKVTGPAPEVQLTSHPLSEL